MARSPPRKFSATMSLLVLMVVLLLALNSAFAADLEQPQDEHGPRAVLSLLGALSISSNSSVPEMVQEKYYLPKGLFLSAPAGKPVDDATLL